MSTQRELPNDNPEIPNEGTIWIVAANFDDDPHPHILGVFTDEAEADALMDNCQSVVSPPHPVAWEKVEQEVLL